MRLTTLSYSYVQPTSSIASPNQRGGDVLKRCYKLEAKHILNEYFRILNQTLSSNGVLHNNKSITSLYERIAWAYSISRYEERLPISSKQFKDMIKEMTNAKIKLLDTYKSDKEMQNNEGISSNIGNIVMLVETDEECNFAIEVLKDSEGKYNATRKNYDNTQMSFYHALINYLMEKHIPVDLKRMIFKEPVLDRVLYLGTINEILKEDPSRFHQLKDILTKSLTYSSTLDKYRTIYLFALGKAFEFANPVQHVLNLLKNYS